MKKASQMQIRVRHPERFDYTPGKGIVVQLEGEEISVGNWTIFNDRAEEGQNRCARVQMEPFFVTRGGHLPASIPVADIVRTEANASVQSLQSLGLKTILLTGDSKAVTESVGRALGVDDILAELLPEQKLQRVERLLGGERRASPRPSDSRVAMGSGTDVASESSEVVLVGSDLSKLVETVQTVRRCHRTIIKISQTPWLSTPAASFKAITERFSQFSFFGPPIAG